MQATKNSFLVKSYSYLFSSHEIVVAFQCGIASLHQLINPSLNKDIPDLKMSISCSLRKGLLVYSIAPFLPKLNLNFFLLLF